MEVVFFGNEKLATGIKNVEPIIQRAVVAAGYTIEKVVTGAVESLGTHRSQIAVLAAYGRILPQRVLDEFPLGIINIHPSLLPIYRGPTPIEQAILDGTSRTGVSIMRLTNKMDEGPLYKQKTVKLTGKESKQELAVTLQSLGAELLIEVMPAITNNDLKPRHQPHPDRATYSRLLKKEDGVLEWTKSAELLEREVRAFAGWPGSQTTLAGLEVSITQAAISSEGSVEPGRLTIEKAQLLVSTGNRQLEILRLKPAGKREMSVVEFLAGYRSKLEQHPYAA